MQERQTKQKQIIYRALQALDHPTATEVYGQVHENYPTVSRATVFRVLSGFAASGQALELRFAGSEVRYDYNTRAHCHARCVCCGRVADVVTEAGKAMAKMSAVACNDFEIEGCAIEFYGRCKDCKADMRA